MNLFRPSSWSTIERTFENRSAILLTQFSMIGFLGSAVQLTNDLILFNFKGMILDFILLIIFISIYILNESGRFVLAKVLFIIIINGALFLATAVVPQSSGVHFIFFPLMVVTFLIFNQDETVLKYASLAYLVFLLGTLHITDFQPFGEINWTEGKAEASSYLVNLAISIFTIVFSLHHMNEMNGEVINNLNAAQKELKEKNTKLAKANEELDYFVYSASHDLKAPLTTIMGLVNLANYEVKDEKSNKYFTLIRGRVERLMDFIKDVIELSRNSRTVVDYEGVDLKKTIEEIFEDLLDQEKIPKSRLSFCGEEDGLSYTDKSRIKIIFSNIISNSIKYRNTSNECFEIKVRIKKLASDTIIDIQDNGIGIENDEIGKVFDMFYKGSASKDSSGLGLYIVKNAVEKLGGFIELSSVPKLSTTVRVVIPNLNDSSKLMYKKQDRVSQK
ncbi:MAG: HAMP domain-containing histidine kinase [Cyclobacteriaceae bacterium]|nr:HAMP domain-containing histidine kinase [Cyclobacteriaceae bacterium]MCH8514914.1 HAMP domain-containing histidine kinase [Cyclobacteriaceae bacterium]